MAKWNLTTRFGDIVASDTKVGYLTITVHHYIGYPPDQWLLTCSGIFNNKKLASPILAEAQTQALALVQVELEKALADILNVERRAKCKSELMIHLQSK